jgi:hypothetical protein
MLPLIAGAGCLAALAIAVVAARHASITEHSPIRAPGRWSTAWTWGLIAAFALYVLGLVLLSRRRASLPAVVALAAAIQLAPLAAPLLLSTDAYSYWDYARIATVQHGNPYADRPSRFPHDPAYARMGKDWQGKPSVYGPAFTLASEAAARDSRSGAIRFFRVLAALGSVALVVITALAARRRAFAAAFVGWNPLLALHFAGGGHNDVLMMAFLAGGLALAARGRFQLEGAAWAAALSIKLTVLVFLPLRVLEARRRGRPIGAVGFAVVALLVATAASIAFGYDWLRVLSPVANQLHTPSSLGLAYWASRLGFPQRYAVDGLLLVFALVYLWLLREAWRGRARLGLTACGLLLATSWLQPWYAVWALPLAAVEEDRLAQAVAIALSAYFLRDALPV